MATKPPNIKKSAPRPQNPNQPPSRIIDNPPADSLAKALANRKRAIDVANKRDPTHCQDGSTRLRRKASAEAQSLGSPYCYGRGRALRALWSPNPAWNTLGSGAR